MKPRTIILLVVAVVCGLGAMYMTSRLLADKGTPPPVNTVKVLLSKKRVDPWVAIKKPEDLFEVKEVPEGTYSTKCLTDLKQLQDKELMEPLDEQLPITADKLATKETAGIFYNLPDGQRAIAIRVSPESLAGGFVLPQSRVDVMFIKKRGDADSNSQIVLQNMLVLAVDLKNTHEESERTMLGSTATLAATPEEAEQLALAQSLGDLRLLLRKPGDTASVQYKAVGITQLGGQQRPSDETRPIIASADTAVNGNAGGALPSFPKADKTPPVVQPAAPEKAPETAKQALQHELVIENGDSITSFVYTWDDENHRWAKDRSAKKSDAAPPSDAGKVEEDAPKQKSPAGNQDRGPVG